MAEETITKRLHVSGLTPAIRATDLSQKLGTFGVIKAVDGFEKVDGLGQPRKFGYITIETTKSKLARCMNLLSGVTWKGAKLRIGEAKPDFRERLAKEREDDGQPLRKRRRLPKGVQGVHSADMSLITPENVQQHATWRVTPTGRIYRPVRMRPGHPLPDHPSTAKPAASSKADKKPRKRASVPPTRARRRTIDPTKWGSQHLKGVLLENDTPLQATERTQLRVPVEESESEEDDEDDADEDAAVSLEEDLDEASEQTSHVSADAEEPTEVPIASIAPTVEDSNHAGTSSAAAGSEPNLAAEKNTSLGLLHSLFGSKGEWVGQDDPDSDLEMDIAEEQKMRKATTQTEVADDIEIVPLEKSPHVETKVTSPIPVSQEVDVQPTPGAAVSKPEPLKELFAPREEEGGFSLLGHLDLDLDLDDDVLNAAFAPTEPAPQSALEAPVQTTTIHSTSAHTQFTFDPTQPLFYPLSDEERAGFRGKVKDPLDVARENGWDWRSFHRTQTSDEIKQRWETQKGELTRDWKRRHREAVKSRRRRGGNDGE